jgi:hypothetical protein
MFPRAEYMPVYRGTRPALSTNVEQTVRWLKLELKDVFRTCMQFTLQLDADIKIS